jgi:hypothetical protein
MYPPQNVHTDSTKIFRCSPGTVPPVATTAARIAYLCSALRRAGRLPLWRYRITGNWSAGGPTQVAYLTRGIAVSYPGDCVPRYELVCKSGTFVTKRPQQHAQQHTDFKEIFKKVRARTFCAWGHNTRQPSPLMLGA